jgi:hypothetical protein
MAYIQGGLIEAVDFNTFRTQLLQVYGSGFGDSGYGQSVITVPTVAGGLVEIVKSLEWTRFRNAISACALHQGTASLLLPPTTDLEPGDVIYAYDGITNTLDIPQMLADISTNRLNAAPTSMSTFTNRSTQTVSNAWNTSATTTLDLTWATEDQARYFFNSGGEIRIRASRSGGVVNAKNTSWTTLLTDVGTVAINYNNTTRSGTLGTTSAFGYYNLPAIATFQTLLSASPSAGYSGNTYVVAAHTVGINGLNGDNGHTVRVRVTLSDPTAGATTGDLTIAVDEYRATTHLTVPSFTVGVVAPLVAV